MVAGAILGLGVPLGEQMKNNLEDADFNQDLHRGSTDDFLTQAREAIAARNSVHPIWGWKSPHAPRYLDRLIGDLRAPHLVCVYRDPIPMAVRSSARGELEDAAAFTITRLRAQVRNTTLIETLGVPCLMVSYEKASSYPIVFIEELADFLGLSVPDHINEIVEFMAPGSYKSPNKLLARVKPRD